MTTKKQSTKKASKRTSVKAQARAIIADVKGYNEETRHSIKNSLDGNDSNLAELVRRAESGETILDVSASRGGVPDEAEQFKSDAVAYARQAYDAALAHYEANHKDAFALSRLAVVYGETDPEDFHIIVTLPGYLRDESVKDILLRDWVKTAELIARTLEHPECTEAFRDAFRSIFAEHMLDKSGIGQMTPAVVRVMLPLVMLATSSGADVPVALDILTTLTSDLVDDNVDREVRKSLGMQ